MNLEQNKQFEAQLRKIAPTRVDEALGKRIDEALRREARARRFAKLRSSVIWGGIAIAASALITFGVLLFNGRLALAPASGEPSPEDEFAAETLSLKTPSEEGIFNPVLAENNLQNRIDEGIVFLRNGLTARRYRYQFVDRVVWQNPMDGATVEMKIPRDEVVLIPVQTF